MPKLKDGKHYEAREGVPADLARTTPTRARRRIQQQIHAATSPTRAPARSAQRTDRSDSANLLAFSGFLAHAKDDFPP
jgi:hypothetical protein